MLERLTPRQFPIAYKLALVFTSLTTVGMFSLGVLVVQDQTRFLREQMSGFGATVARQLAESAKEQLLADDRLGLQATLANLVGDHSVLGAAVYSELGEVIVQSGLVPPEMPDEATHHEPYEWSSEEEGLEEPRNLTSFVTPVIFQEVTVGYALLTLDRGYMDGAESQTIRAVGGATFALICIGIGASVFLGRRLTRPIHQLMAVSRAITEGDYQVRFDERRNDELGALMQSMNTMTEGLLRKEQVEQTFSRYVSPKVAKEVLAHIESIELGGRRVDASVLFADIVGFTSMSENMRPEEVSALLNDYFSYIAEAALAFNGYVDKYIGDCAMLVFGVPAEDEEHTFHAVACGIVIERIIRRLNAEREAVHLPPVEFRVGINSGPMLAGNMGSRDRMEYTVVGDAVNLASRLASAGEPGQVVVSGEVHYDPRLVGRVQSRKLGTIRLRGKKLPVATYQITDLADDYRDFVEEKVQAIMKKVGES